MANKRFRQFLMDRADDEQELLPEEVINMPPVPEAYLDDELREELNYCDPLPMANPYKKSEEESEEFQDVAGLDYGDQSEQPDDDEGMDPEENM